MHYANFHAVALSSSWTAASCLLWSLKAFLMAYPGWITLLFIFVLYALLTLFAAATSENLVHDLCSFGDVDETNGSIFLNTSDASSELRCSRVIRIKGSGRLSLEITEYRIASEDELEIYDGPHSSARKLRNISKPFLFTASGNAIFIRFRRMNGSEVSSSFHASFNRVPYPKECQCRRVTNGTLECEEKYKQRECRVKCDKGYYDIYLGTKVTCDMQNKGKWDIDIHERALCSCQKVSAPSKIRLRVSFSILNGTCEPLEIEKAFKGFLTSSDGVKSNGKCFGDQDLSCTIKPVEVTCENGTRVITVNITDAPQVDVESRISTFGALYAAYGNLDFHNFLSTPGVLNVTINVTSLVLEPITPVCPNSLLFIKWLVTGKENLSHVCSACPIHHFYNSSTSQCMVDPRGSTASQGPESCTNGSKSVHLQHNECDIKCMAGKQYNKNSGFCEWCPYDQYRGPAQTPSQTCQQCPPDRGTLFSGAFNVSECYKKCIRGTFLVLRSDACHKCPLDTYQNESDHLFTQCKACGNGRHTVAEGSITGQNCFGPCSAGTFFDEQARNCMECPIHSYQDDINQQQCKNCSDGKMTLKPGATNESSCIVPCQAGQSFNMDTRRCENCSKGSFQDQTQHLFTQCKACGNGRYTVAEGSITGQNCFGPCSAGTFFDEQVRNCMECPMHSYQDDINQHQCKNCSNGKMTVKPGATNELSCIVPCQAGQSFNMDTRRCENCSKGSFQEQNNHLQEECKPCNASQTTTQSGAKNVSECNTCHAGEFADKKQCQKCPKGYFQELPNQSSCKPCPSGKTTQEEGQTNMTACGYLCPAGTFLDRSRKNCSPCPFGTYQDSVDHSLEQCMLCLTEETLVATGAVSVGSCISNCSMYPCQHGAPCHSKGDGFTCQCGNRLHGKLCEVIENEDKLRTVAVSLNITSLKWRTQLANHKTFQYHMTKGLIEAAIGEVMVGSDQYVATEVTDLTKGSVVAYFTLFFDEHSDPIPDRKLQIAAAHGSVGNLDVSSLEYLQNTCTTALGMEDGYIKDGQITASTQHTNAKAWEGRLNKGAGWHAMYTGSNEFLQIDFQKMVNVTGVASQGMQDDDSQECFVKGYKLGFSDDGKNWISYFKMFVGNIDSHSVVKNYLEPPVSARYIRFNPKAWQNRICMRVEVYGCLLDPKISPEDIPMTSPTAITTTVTTLPSFMHTTVLVSKSKYVWGSYVGIVFFTLFLVVSVVALCCWKQKSKRKRKARTVEQHALLLRTSDGLGRYKGIIKTANVPDQDGITENQV